MIQVNGRELLAHQTAIAIVGEPVSITPVPTLVSGPDATVDVDRFTFTEPGEAHLSAAGRDFVLLAFEPACLALIADQTGGRLAPRTYAERVNVLRNYALHGRVRSGLAEDMRLDPEWGAFA